ncbi:MAG: aromatic ring-hydroxylating dioxygenase subunit alpha [Thermoleophilia bacterium]|nr:aromatic ring-hydroxylating dioxygenase subunit alpha [Thermoleophilia bacterium]MDH4345375.1 aromatic ring-hydroxylating dioxygenase subunit alpha [Thermoleophilia bacterium]MDH5333474.1 aromatic ring-hydroxylating dioxygenase subunit alpha [Thermoleophilia bacterium]
MALTSPRTLPYDWYADPQVLRLEQERIFAHSWQYVARVDQVAEPGQFAAVRAGHVPIVLVRSRDGALRGFVNICRHRGFVLCEGEGSRETLQCPYHAWTYDLDGSLRAAPRSDREPGFPRDDLGLLPVSVARWGPFVFANPDPEAPPLEETLGELPALLRSGGVDLDGMAFRLRADAEPYDANWKVIVENFLECYHCSVAHPTLAKAIDVSVDGYRLETHPTFSSQIAEPRNGGGGVYDAAGELGRGQFHFLFPGTVINVMPGRQNLSIGPVLPDAPERTTRFLDYFFAPDTEQAWVDDYLALDDLVGAEDRVLVERVQSGLRTGAVPHGHLLAESEQLIAHFQALVVDALGAEDH